jgi:hypothetical protein
MSASLLRPGRCAAALLGWALCAAVRAGLPDVAGVQAAYEAAREDATGTHENDLLIQTAQCRPLPGSTDVTACQIDFVRKLDPQGRLYFDVITVQARRAGQWTLLSGLCLTRPRTLMQNGLRSGAVLPIRP